MSKMLRILAFFLGVSSLSLASRPGNKDDAASMYEVTATSRGAFHARAIPNKTATKDLKAFSADDLRTAFDDHFHPLPERMLDALPSSLVGETQSLQKRASGKKESGTALAEMKAKTAESSTLDASLVRKKKKDKGQDDEESESPKDQATRDRDDQDGRGKDAADGAKNGDGWSSEEEQESVDKSPESEDDQGEAGDSHSAETNVDGVPGGCRLGYPKKCKKHFVDCGQATEEKKCGVFKKDFQKLCCHPTSMPNFVAKNAPSMPTEHGQILRGTLDFNGYAFAIHMDRQAWKKVYQKKTLSRGEFWQAQGSMSFKLLRYPKDEKDQASKGRKFKAGKVDLQDVIHKGWIGHVQLVGWWDDQTQHFRGKAVREEKVKSQDDWLSHAMLPWREIDLRFDDEGAHCRFDWFMQKGFFGKIGDAFTGKDMSFGIMRLDALPANEDPSKVFVGMVYEKEILSEMTIRTDRCSTGKSKGAFICAMEQRPLSTTRAVLYREPAFGHTDKGAWFTFMGTVGKLLLEFTPEGGNFVAKPVNAICAGLDPCPFIVAETFDAQIIDKQVLMRQRGGAAEQRGTWFFYPIFDDNAMEINPNYDNLHGFDPQKTSVVPELGAHQNALVESQEEQGDAATPELLRNASESEEDAPAPSHLTKDIKQHNMQEDSAENEEEEEDSVENEEQQDDKSKAVEKVLGGCRLGWPKKCKKGFVQCGQATDEKKCGLFKKDFQKLCCAEAAGKDGSSETDDKSDQKSSAESEDEQDKAGVSNWDKKAVERVPGGCRLGWPKKCKKGFTQCGKATDEKKCGLFKKDFQKLCCREDEAGSAGDECRVETFSDEKCAKSIKSYSSEDGSAREFKFDKGSAEENTPTHYKIKGTCKRVELYDNDYAIAKGNVDVYGSKASCTELPSDLRKDLGGLKIFPAGPDAPVCFVRTFREAGCKGVVNEYRSFEEDVPNAIKFKSGIVDQVTPTHYEVSGSCKRVEFIDADVSMFRQNVNVHGTASCAKFSKDLSKDLGGLRIWAQSEASSGEDGQEKDSVEACEVLLFEEGKCNKIVNTYRSDEEEPKDFKFDKGSDEMESATHYRVKGSCSRVQFMDNDFKLAKGDVDVYGNKASCTRLPYDLRKDLGGLKIWANAATNVCTVKTYSSEGCFNIVNSYRSSEAEKEFKFSSKEKTTPTHYKISGQCQLVQFQDNDWFSKQNLDIHGTCDCTELPKDLKKDLKGVKIWISEKAVKTLPSTASEDKEIPKDAKSTASDDDMRSSSNVMQNKTAKMDNEEAWHDEEVNDLSAELNKEKQLNTELTNTLGKKEKGRTIKISPDETVVVQAATNDANDDSEKDD